MITTQQQLDVALDRPHLVQVHISPDGPLPQNKQVYNSLTTLPQQGFSFTPRELLHAIGCKTAALPTSDQDECLKSAWLYTNILDLEGPYLLFRGAYGSDLQISRSQEIGIGMLCLIAERHSGIPWDQLGPLPGQGKRFDYRGSTPRLRCIFESKGTSHRSNQRTQILSGLDKKTAHHARGEHFDVELIISFCIEHNDGPPRIVLADPDKSSFEELYARGDDRYFRLKHYCRVLQYVGLPRSSYYLNRYAREYLHTRRSVYRTILDEKADRGHLESVTIDGDEFLGRWYDNWLPDRSKRYQRLYNMALKLEFADTSKRRSVFQGIRRDVYEAGLTSEPFSQPLLDEKAKRKYRRLDQSGVSVFPDGTVMAFRQR
jgi:hypothetical protein